MEHHVSLSISLDNKHDSSFADDLITQFDLKREQLYTDDDNTNTPLHTTPFVSESTTHHSDEDNAHDMLTTAETSVTTVLSQPSSPTPIKQQNRTGLLRRSSTFLRQKFTTSAPPPLPTNQVVPPCQYPPKPLAYCPVDPPTDDQPRRTSFPTLVPWRKKHTQDPRRQSEPAVTPAKPRKSFFF